MMLHRGTLCAVLFLIGAAGCGGSMPGPPESRIPDPEKLTPLSGSEIRYLAFQIVEGGPDPAIPFDSVLIYTPKEKISSVAREIANTIGVVGRQRAKLAIVLGPIAFDHTDAEARQIIRDGFEIADALNVAVGFHLDDSMFWSRRRDLLADSANVEWTDFSGKLSTGLLLNWAHPPPRMCFNSPKIQAEVTRRARDVIGAEIAAGVASLTRNGKATLFAGVIAGWETHVGQDAGTKNRVGFHALANRGFGPGRPPANVSDEIASIAAEFTERWTNGLAAAGIDPARIYSHVAFVSRQQFAALQPPPPLTYADVLDLAPSSQRPSVAFVSNARPGFTTYPVPGIFDDIEAERARHATSGWASSEGTNHIPGGAAGSSKMTTETYLARGFNYGATLVNLFSWGIGGRSVITTDPFRIATHGPEALATYRRFLDQ